VRYVLLYFPILAGAVLADRLFPGRVGDTPLAFHYFEILYASFLSYMLVAYTLHFVEEAVSRRRKRRLDVVKDVMES